MACRGTRDWMLRGLGERSPDLHTVGPNAVPWLYPLGSLVQRKPDEKRTPLHQSFTRVIATNDIWTTDRLSAAGMIDGGRCRACGAPASCHHRCWDCPARYLSRHVHGFESCLRAATAKDAALNPLWTRALVPDSTRCLPPPSSTNSIWTVKPPAINIGPLGVVYQFADCAFGDGSGVTPFDDRSTRCGFGGVQVSIRNGITRVVACLLPLPPWADPVDPCG